MGLLHNNFRFFRNVVRRSCGCTLSATSSASFCWTCSRFLDSCTRLFSTPRFLAIQHAIPRRILLKVLLVLSNGPIDLPE